ncbi:MAG: hypothetical protein PF513_03125 [Tenericutes bacterium]|jgi:hypothetical protein|nr:hypothetical protein [Mycoplasmatota bacterium]
MSNKKTNNPLSGIDYKDTLFNPRWFIENMLKIVDKAGHLIPFKLNDEQLQMLDHIEFCLNNDVPIRMIVLKARQIGSTTFFSAIGFWFAVMNLNTKYGIVAHRLDSASSIFEKCKIFYNNLPKALRPSTIQMSSEGITFDKKDGSGINSKISFATVNEGVFRGQTLSYLHLTECAFWEGNVQAIENSLGPTISLHPRTMIVRESTANGYNFFKDDWDRAIKGQSDYTNFFFGWQDHAEYTMKPPLGFKMTEKEELLKKEFDLTDGQILWRRYQIDNVYSGNPTWFKQENPMTPQEAFVASGTGVFDPETIVAGMKHSKKPIRKFAPRSYPTFEKVMVWEEPKTEHEKIYQQKSVWDDDLQDYKYVDTELLLEEREYQTPYTLGLDTSGMGADKNQIVVINNITKALACRFEIKNLSERFLAKIAVEIAIMYNDAKIAPEVNYSHAICDYIMEDEKYTNIYITESMTRKDRTVTGGIEYGFKTTTLTKAPIISALRTLVTEVPSIIPDEDFWYEAEYYIMEDTARNVMNATQGHHDDIIMATAIALYVSNSFQSNTQKIIVRKKDEDQSFLVDMFNKHSKRKKTKIRKGVYNNHA